MECDESKVSSFCLNYGNYRIYNYTYVLNRHIDFGVDSRILTTLSPYLNKLIQLHKSSYVNLMHDGYVQV